MTTERGILEVLAAAFKDGLDTESRVVLPSLPPAQLERLAELRQVWMEIHESLSGGSDV